MLTHCKLSQRRSQASGVSRIYAGDTAWRCLRQQWHLRFIVLKHYDLHGKPGVKLIVVKNYTDAAIRLRKGAVGGTVEGAVDLAFFGGGIPVGSIEKYCLTNP